MHADEFRKAGHLLIDAIAEFLDSIRSKPVTPGETPGEVRAILGNESLPEKGRPTDTIFSRAAELLFNHSLLNGHPKFFGYITSSPAPAGALADLLAAAVNPNVGANILSPVATEIEKQTIQWLAEFIGVSPAYGGLLVSGGNMANFTGFLTGRNVKGPKSIKENGISNDSQKLLIYCPKTTHTWIEKAAILFGLGTNSIRWINTDQQNKMIITALEETINDDLAKNHKPLMVIGTAGDVSTGAVDDLRSIAAICKKYDLWFHIDGAYGIPAAVVPELKSIFRGIEEADSIALDPHKWLYSPLEAGCTLVKDPNHLLETYSSHPVYYNFDNNDEPSLLNFYEYGLQNSRGFRALKVWVALQQAGRSGYEKMIREDIRLSKLLFELADNHPELEAITQSLSIATFRFVPADIKDSSSREEMLNQLNEALLNSLQKKGEVFLSNAVVNDKYCLRCCIVNFRTTEKDIREVINIVIKEGKELYPEFVHLQKE
jgi:glutamate/tyrosine decarboxylase-like PLP-dependent enzyme